MAQLLVAVSIAGVVSIVALVVRRRRRSDAPTQKIWSVPEQLDPLDIFDGEAEWGIVVFSSASCHVCADVVAKARALGSRRVEIREFEYSTSRVTHEKYRIDAVPTLLMCDRSGVVRHSILGPVTATDLWAAVARVRDPGSAPIAETCTDH